MKSMSQVEVIPLGGCGEIGKNMTVIRQGDEILVVDAGLSFPTPEMHGVDIVIPDITYLKNNAEKVLGIVLTHGHEDHVGALPYVLPEIRCPVYGTELTLALVRRRLLERLTPDVLDLRPLVPRQPVEIGSFLVEAIHMTHSLPDACSLALGTRIGTILVSGDFKFDFTPVDQRLPDMDRLSTLGSEGVTLLLCDCTNVEFPGWCPSERSVVDSFRRIFSEAPGRILLTTFATHIHRLQIAVDLAREVGRKVAIAGRRMEQTLATASEVGHFRFPRENYVPLDRVDRLPPQEVLILTTGSQGEPLSALSLMAKEEYPKASILPGDTVIFSARPIPGNESAIWGTVNRLFRQGARVLYGPEAGVHASGHGYQEEIKLLIALTRPAYLAPVHGEPRHQRLFVEMVKEMGYTEENVIVMENGNRLVVKTDEAYLTEDVECGRVLVDTSGYAGVSDEVLRDRQNLASEGVLFINVAIDSDAGKVVSGPELMAKGLQASDGELQRLKEMLYHVLTTLSKAELRDQASLHQEISDLARRYLKKEINKRPLVMTTITDV